LSASPQKTVNVDTDGGGESLSVYIVLASSASISNALLHQVYSGLLEIIRNTQTAGYNWNKLDMSGSQANENAPPPLTRRLTEEEVLKDLYAIKHTGVPS
jgi:hypothetical protein